MMSDTMYMRAGFPMAWGRRPPSVRPGWQTGRLRMPRGCCTPSLSCAKILPTTQVGVKDVARSNAERYIGAGRGQARTGKVAA